MNVMNVKKTSLQIRELMLIRENIQERSHMGTATVGKLLPICQSLINIREFTDSRFEKNLFAVVSLQENSMH